MNAERVILVDENDRETGTAEKLEAHEKGLLHRAVSVVLFQKEDPALILLQQRSAAKYHSPLMWANGCCSHPRPGEATLAAALRRVREELAIDAPELSYAGHVLYRAPVGALTEHEYDHVYVGFLSRDANIPLNPAEVAAVEWAKAKALPQDGRAYAPWLAKVMEAALKACR